MTTLQAMLLQGGEDCPRCSVSLLPAWPCDRDVSFRLWAARNTSISVVFASGKLVSLDVEPPERAADVSFAGCV